MCRIRFPGLGVVKKKKNELHPPLHILRRRRPFAISENDVVNANGG